MRVNSVANNNQQFTQSLPNCPYISVLKCTTVIKLILICGLHDSGYDSLSPSILETPLSHCSVDSSVISAMAAKSKWRSTYDSDRRPNKTWEGMYPWVIKAPDGSENSFCRLCHAIMQPRLSAVVAHEKTKKHQQKVRAAASTLPLPVVRTQRVAENVRHAELQLAILTACHMSFQVVDHLGEVIAHNGEESLLGELSFTAPSAAN